MVSGEQALYFHIFGRRGPVFELDGVSLYGAHAKGKTGLVKVVHGQQRFHRVAAGREERALVGQKVTLVSANHQNFLCAFIKVLDIWRRSGRTLAK